MSTSDEVIAKLQKILARADATRNPSQAEVETAMRMAQELALKHGIDLASVDTDEDTTAPGFDLTKDEVMFRSKNENAYHRYVYRVLTVCCDVKLMWSAKFVGWTQRPVAIIVGEQVDVQIAKYCFSFLEHAFPDCMHDWAHANGYPGRVPEPVRHDFYRGFADGIIDANRKVKAEAVKANTNLGLVLVNKESAVAAFFAQEFPNTTSRRSRQVGSGNYTAIEAGRAAGKSIKLAAAAIA